MYSFNNYIKFALDIKNQNIVFEDYFFRLKTEIRYPAANASQPVIIRLFKQRVWCRTCNKRSMTSIAWENNVSVNTVQRVLGSCSQQFSSSYDYLPKHLAFDEFLLSGHRASMLPQR